MKRRVPSVPLRFVVVGLANTMIGLGTIYLLKWLVGMSDTAANVGGCSLGLAASFLFNRTSTTRAHGYLRLLDFSWCLRLPTPLTSERSFAPRAI